MPQDIIDSKPFHIYRSGAGSGKTFTLAKSYLTLALSRGSSFRNILGVTFTNKATEEMKNRIVSILKVLASGESHPMQDDLCEALSINKPELKRRAGDTLSDILHQYGRFSIVTIDSFFNQVIRSFAKEMGLQGTFTIDLDQKTVLERVIDKMLLEIGDDDKKQLRGWLTEFAELRVEDGQSWDFRKEIIGLSGEILKDEFKRHSDEVLKLSDQPGFFANLKKDLNKQRYQFEGQVKKLCQQFFTYSEKEGLDISDFTRGKNGPAGLFEKLFNLDFDISDTRRAANGDIEKWLTKTNLKKGHLNQHLESSILPLYSELIDYVDNHIVTYQSVKEVQRYLFTFGILAQVNKYIQKYRDENDVMLIADLPDFLHQIINDSDTPYIYEKVGSIFNHYLIDEFQDTSAFQWDNFMPLVKNTTDEGNFSMVVGDVKQSIYRFRGGEWQLLQHQLKGDIGDYHVETHNLGVNWRSDPTIVHFNNDFFKRASQFSIGRFIDTLSEVPDEAMRAQIESKVHEVFGTFEDVAQEVPEFKKESNGCVQFEFIADEDTEDDESWMDESISRTIRQVEELQRKGYELRDIAILTRYIKEGKRVADAFIDYRNSDQADPNLSYEVISSEALYLTSSHLVRFVVSLIKWLNDEQNTIVLSEWLYEYQRYILNKAVAESEIFSVYQHWERVVPKTFTEQKEYLKTLPLYELVEAIVRIFNLNSLKEEFTYLQGFQDAVLDYSKNERGDIPSFLEWWEEVRKERAIQVSDQNNAIKILTVHKAKGLEFPVVIMPFMSWGFDHEGGNDTILWCSGKEAPEPFNRLPVLPLKYSKNLASTYWATSYYQERLKAYLDNLNLLYVALTRPVQVMLGYGKLPKPTSKSFAAYTLLLELLKDSEHWNEEQSKFQIGSIPENQQKPRQTLEYGLEAYYSTPWRGKVGVQIKGSAELSEAVFVDATLQGIQMHDVLSKIHYAAHIEKYVGLPVYEELKNIVEHPQIADWFQEKWRVDNEVPILLPGGDFKRIDRIIRSDSETVIIDFKTGTQRKKDQYQVKEYMKILTEMGYPKVSGYLVYLSELKVEEVK